MELPQTVENWLPLAQVQQNRRKTFKPILLCMGNLLVRIRPQRPSFDIALRANARPKLRHQLLVGLHVPKVIHLPTHSGVVGSHYGVAGVLISCRNTIRIAPWTSRSDSKCHSSAFPGKSCKVGVRSTRLCQRKRFELQVVS